jgi:hypothetical protein
MSEWPVEGARPANQAAARKAYLRISKIATYRQRRDLREVIETLSRFMVVTSCSLVSSHEIEALLDRIVGPNPKPVNRMDYVDWGLARALGRRACTVGSRSARQPLRRG